MSKTARHRTYVDSRCRDWIASTNGNRFVVDLRRPLTNVTKIDIIQATVPVYASVFWEEEVKNAAIRVTGMYRRDVQQALPTQLPSDVVAMLPLSTAFPSAFSYTFYMNDRDSGLWHTTPDAKMAIPRVDRLDISLLVPAGGATLYPLPDAGYAVDQNWTLVLELTHSGLCPI